MRQVMTTQQKQLFEMTVQLNDSGCWAWQGQVSNSGYGRIKVSDSNNETKMVSAQTASYLQFVAKVPDGYLVKQNCGNRLCINPQHLELMKV